MTCTLCKQGGGGLGGVASKVCERRGLERCGSLCDFCAKVMRDREY
eukprot:gene10243-8009_t